MKSSTFERILDAATAVIIGLALTALALAFFDVLI